MLGFRPNIFWRTCWRYVTPSILSALVIYLVIEAKFIKDDASTFPAGAHAVGVCIAVMGSIWLPLVFVWRVMKQTHEKTLIDVRKF